MINLLAHSNIRAFLCLVPRSRGPYKNNQGKIDLKARMGGVFFKKPVWHWIQKLKYECLR